MKKNELHKSVITENLLKELDNGVFALLENYIEETKISVSTHDEPALIKIHAWHDTTVGFASSKGVRLHEAWKQSIPDLLNIWGGTIDELADDMIRALDAEKHEIIKMKESGNYVFSIPQTDEERLIFQTNKPTKRKTDDETK